MPRLAQGLRGTRVPEAKEAVLLLQAWFPQGLLCCRLLSWSPPGLEAASQGLRRSPREGSAHCASSQQGLERYTGSTQNSLTLFPQLSSTPGWTVQVSEAPVIGCREGPAGRSVGALCPSIPGHLCACRPLSAPSQVGRLPLNVGGGKLRRQSPAMLSSPFVTGAVAFWRHLSVTPSATDLWNRALSPFSPD